VDWKIGSTRGSPILGFQPACKHFVAKFHVLGSVTFVVFFADSIIFLGEAFVIFKFLFSKINALE
jgi:hypothetical protein